MERPADAMPGETFAHYKLRHDEGDARRAFHAALLFANATREALDRTVQIRRQMVALQSRETPDLAVAGASAAEETMAECELRALREALRLGAYWIGTNNALVGYQASEREDDEKAFAEHAARGGR